MKVLVGAFNQEKALVGAFSVIVQPVVQPMDRFTALIICTPTFTVFRESSDEAGEAAAASGLGAVYAAMGQAATALDFHLLDLDIGQRTGDKAAQIRACANIGAAYEAMGEFDKAGSYHDQLLNIATLVNDREAKIKAFSNLGEEIRHDITTVVMS